MYMSSVLIQHLHAAASSCWSTILLGTLHIGVCLNLEHGSVYVVSKQCEDGGGGGGG